MDTLGVAILVVAVFILLYLSSATRGRLRAVAPWAALLGGGLVVGAFLTAPSSDVYGGGAKSRRPLKHASGAGESYEDVETLLSAVSDEAAGLAGAENEEGKALEGLGAYVVDTGFAAPT